MAVRARRRVQTFICRGLSPPSARTVLAQLAAQMITPQFVGIFNHFRVTGENERIEELLNITAGNIASGYNTLIDGLGDIAAS